MSSKMIIDMIARNIIDAGELRISKTTLGKRKEADRYLIYLPINRNYVWRVLHQKGQKVRVYLEIPSESEKDRMMEKDLYEDPREDQR